MFAVDCFRVTRAHCCWFKTF